MAQKAAQEKAAFARLQRQTTFLTIKGAFDALPCNRIKTGPFLGYTVPIQDVWMEK